MPKDEIEKYTLNIKEINSYNYGLTNYVLQQISCCNYIHIKSLGSIKYLGVAEEELL